MNTVQQKGVDDHIKERFEEYALALGKVAHAWNYLQEKLGALFGTVIGQQDGMAFAIWYSSNSDRSQRGMLEAAANAPTASFSHPKAKEDILWLVKKAINTLSAETMLCMRLARWHLAQTNSKLFHHFSTGIPRAKNLIGKNILNEFAWYEAIADELSRFAEKLNRAILVSEYPWPSRPSIPSLSQLPKTTPKRH
jgi:hypothetical protein